MKGINSLEYASARVISFPVSSLSFNSINQNLYSIDEKFQDLVDNIQQLGILEPLVISKDNVVISGNRRLRAAILLSIESVPVIIKDDRSIDGTLEIVSHNLQRIKLPSQIIAELEILKKHYPVKQGQRSDLSGSAKRNKERIDSAFEHSKTTIYRLGKINELSQKLYGKNSKDYKDLWNKLDKGYTSVNAVYNALVNKKKEKANKKAIPAVFDLETKEAKIFNKSCADLNELDSESVATIITSPPYFNMRNYKNGAEELGLENSIDDYLENLIRHFGSCWDILKDDGSLFVNLNDCIVDGSYQMIPQQFALRMIKKGWRLNDEIIWCKHNPTYTIGDRSVRAHEYIFHFVKAEYFYYDLEWMKDIKDEDSLYSLGRGSKGTKLKSSFDFRGNILTTSTSNISDLRKECKKAGFTCSHSATFPPQVPLIAILSTSRPGDLVLDIFNGTGTSGEIAIANGRKYVGYELNPEFVKVSEVRIAPYLSQVA